MGEYFVTCLEGELSNFGSFNDVFGRTESCETAHSIDGRLKAALDKLVDSLFDNSFDVRFLFYPADSRLMDSDSLRYIAPWNALY